MQETEEKDSRPLSMMDLSLEAGRGERRIKQEEEE